MGVLLNNLGQEANGLFLGNLTLVGAWLEVDLIDYVRPLCCENLKFIGPELMQLYVNRDLISMEYFNTC